MTPAQAVALAKAEAAVAELRRLLEADDAAPVVAPPPSRKLTELDYADAAEVLGVEVRKIKAVAQVESGRLGGFAEDGRPIILFEPHVFSRLTEHRYDATQGGVSYRKWGAKPYPVSQADRWAQLEYAANLDRPAALQSASYGLFQIMGFNFKVCGFADVEAFFAAMHQTEREHLMAFVGYITGNNLAPPLRAGNWLAFAKGYNGDGQMDVYGPKIAAAYAAIA